MCLLEPGTGPYTLGQTFTAEVAGFTYTVRVAFLVESNSRSDDPIIDATFTTPSSGVTTDGILDSLITQIDGVENFTAIKIGSGIYFTREQAFAVETTNGSLSRLLGPTQYEVGDETHFVATATTVSELPTQARDGMIALVVVVLMRMKMIIMLSSVVIMLLMVLVFGKRQSNPVFLQPSTTRACLMVLLGLLICMIQMIRTD